MSPARWGRGGLVLALVLALLAAGAPGRAEIAGQGPPEAPILRIETGMHTAGINAIATDAAGHILASASYDKTLRLFSLESGLPLRTIRVPIAPGREGALYAVAVAPDARRVVAGGWTGSWEQGFSLYVFDVATGRLVRRIAGLPHRPLRIAYAPDGRHLAVAMKGWCGLRIYRTSDFALVADRPVARRRPEHRGLPCGTDPDEGKPLAARAADEIPPDTVWVEFAPDGRLVTASLDGTVRLYDREYRLRARVRAPGGPWPTTAAFSPDGKLVAVGYAEAPRVDILSGADLAFVRTPDLSGVDNGDLWQVAWSADGAYLYAGGLYERAGRHPIRRWSARAEEPLVDMPATEKRVTALLGRPGGGVIYAADDPALGAIDPKGRKIFDWHPAIADYRQIGGALLVSNDGNEVRFGLAPWGQRPVAFSLAHRALEIDPLPAGEGFAGPVRALPGLEVKGWERGYRPRLNGRALSLQPYEKSFSYTLMPDRSGLVLGTSWRLIRYDAAGELRWYVRTPGQVWGITATPDSRLVVAALGDGTIRWYRARDGTELLALFPHPDAKRWVAWSPSGYYGASVGGDTLIGWHVNRGTDAAPDFFSVARFRDFYYRPDVVERVLARLDEGKALAAANAASGRQGSTPELHELLPPVATIVSPADGTVLASPRLALTVEVRSPSRTPVARVLVKADGRPVHTLEGPLDVGRAGAVYTLALDVPRRASVIEVIAENVRGLAGEPAVLHLARAAEPAGERPDLYVLAVGISAYRAKGLVLRFAAKDARDFRAVLREQAGRAFGHVTVRLLDDKAATLAELRAALAWIASAAVAKDVAIVFLAGHGVDDAAGHYRFVPYDADPAHIDATGLDYAELKSALARIPGRALLFLDTCRSGAVWGRAKRPSHDVERIVNDLRSPENGVIVFASSTGGQSALEDDKWGHGAFTKALIEGLEGGADPFREGSVTVTGLDFYVSRRVPKLTQGRQTPATGKPVGADLVLAVLE